MIKKEIKEIIIRNKGDIQDTIDMLNQLILIYSILTTGNLIYRLQVLDLQNLKTKFQVELESYRSEKIN